MSNAYDLRLKNALLDATTRRATGSTTAQVAAAAPVPTAKANGNDRTRAYYFILSMSRLDRDHVLA